MAATVAHGRTVGSRDVAAVHSLPAEPTAAITAAHRTNDGTLDPGQGEWPRGHERMRCYPRASLSVARGGACRGMLTSVTVQHPRASGIASEKCATLASPGWTDGGVVETAHHELLARGCSAGRGEAGHWSRRSRVPRSRSTGLPRYQRVTRRRANNVDPQLCRWSQGVGAPPDRPGGLVGCRPSEGGGDGTVAGGRRERVWELWVEGYSLHAIAREVGMARDNVTACVAASGGVRPAPRKRAERCLSLGEREEISRGLARGEGFRAIAVGICRSHTAVAREVNRNGGRAATAPSTLKRRRGIVRVARSRRSSR